MQIEVLRSFAVDQRRITARQQQLLLIALVAARAQGHPNVDREGLRRALGSLATPVTVTHALKRLRAAFPPGALAHDRKYEALLVDKTAIDAERFSSAAHEAIATSDLKSDRALQQMDEALALCPPTLWTDLVDVTDPAHDALAAFRDRLIATRRSIAIKRAESLLAQDRPHEATAVESDLAADEHWVLGHRDALVLACTRWANDDRKGAADLLREYPVPTSASLRDDWQRISSALADAETWSPRRLPQRTGTPNRPATGDVASTLRRSGSKWRSSVSQPAEMFGRSTQMLQLSRFAEQVPSGQVGTCLVVGPAGSGKSAFLRHAEQMLASNGTRTAAVQCLAGYQRPLGVALDLLHELNPAEATRLDDESGDPARRVALIARALTAEATQSPLALLIDDAQFVDHSSLGILEMVRVMRTGGHQLLVLTAMQPEAPGASPDAIRHLEGSLSNVNATHIHLDPMSEGDAAALCKAALGLPLDVASVWSLGERADWAPGNILEILRRLGDDRLILLDDSTLFFAEHALERVAAAPAPADKLRTLRLLCAPSENTSVDDLPRHRPIAHLCLELHVDSIPLNGRDIDLDYLDTQLAVAASEFEADRTWILAARTWDCILMVAPSVARQQEAAVKAGRDWMLAHDADKALARLDHARQSADPHGRFAATEFLCRTIASLATFEHGDRVLELADEAVAESRDDQSLWAAAARVQCVAAEWLAVCRRYPEARTRISAARSGIGDSRSQDFAYLELSAGIVELLAAQPTTAHGYFLNAQAHCDGDQWILSSAAARALMCLAEFAHDEVTETLVLRAKSISAGAQSWSDYLLSCLASAHAAMLRGDMDWGRTELTEARHLETRASYPLAAEPLRTLWAFGFDGEWLDDPTYMSSNFAASWARSCGHEFVYAADERNLLHETVTRLVADAASAGLDIWNAAQSAAAIDLCARFDPDLEAALAPLRALLTESGHLSALGIARPLPGT